MAKKFVRGITDVKTINNQDFDTNNVNDLLSDGEHNYIHRKKKDKSEEYHNLTNNIKTISSDNTDLLSVTNYNTSNNTATLHPHHDVLKEQVIESTRNTIDIDYGANNTTETTKVDTNPQLVLEHDNLIAGSYLTKEHDESSIITTLKVSDDFVRRVTTAESNINVLQGDVGRVETELETKQDKLTAGENITIKNNIISATIPTPKKITINNDLSAIVYTISNYNYITIISNASISPATINSDNPIFNYLETLPFNSGSDSIFNGLIEIVKHESTYTIISSSTTVNQQLFVGWTE